MFTHLRYLICVKASTTYDASTCVWALHAAHTPSTIMSIIWCSALIILPLIYCAELIDRCIYRLDTCRLALLPYTPANSYRILNKR